MAELLQLAAVLASQRATDIGPSVSFVAVVECSLPLFVMVFSSGLLLISERWKAMSQEFHDTLLLQTTSIPVKLTSVAFILCAIVMVQTKAS
ncbi:MAG: hypothetical protein NPIRA01_38930 [Nitrospirales bacterium]|nr:MAG: hypothetical protein NPIRA01_38930 [Nitrospirales bacterium]